VGSVSAALKIAASPHPAQAELRKALAARDDARRAVDTVQARHDAIEADLEKLAIAVESTRAEFKSAAASLDANATAVARKAYRDAFERHEDAGITREGVSDRLAAAERSLEVAEVAVAKHAGAIAVTAARQTETEAARLATELGVVLARHHRLAQFAAESLTHATGSHQEPIDCSSESTPFSRHVDELLKQPHTMFTVESMLSERLD
jgi:chromosome segregation ATPase